MSNQPNNQPEKYTSTSMVNEPEEYDTENTYDYPNLPNSSSVTENIKPSQSLVLPSKYKSKSTSISTSLQNNIHENSINYSDKRKSITSDYDSSSIIVEINDQVEEEEEVINTSKDKSQSQEFPENAHLRKKLELNNNRYSIATSGDFTIVDTNQPQTTRDTSDLKNMPTVPPLFNEDVEADISNTNPNTNTNTNTDTTTTPKEKDHKIKIDEDEDEDNTCAICLIETQKPSDIEKINKDGSNETVVAPSKEDIDNYECKLHCMHKFHYSCIAQWLERSQNCPICRMEIKHWEIEAIEKRFDISIDVKEEPLPLVVPHYNTSLEFDTELSEDLVRNYLKRHMPWVNFEWYFYTRFFLYFLCYFALVVFGLFICIKSLIDHDLYSVPIYGITVALTISFIVFLVLLGMSIARHKFVLFMIQQPASSSLFYGTVIVVLLLIFGNLNNFISDNDNGKNSLTIDVIYQYLIIIFYAVFMVWSMVEAKICFSMYKEENRRAVDADVTRRNNEITERYRQEEAQEREEFERNFSHLND